VKKKNISLPSLETGAPYNLCIRHGDLIFVSGLPPFDAEFSAQLRNARASGTPAPPFPDLTFEQQVTIVMNNLKALIEAAGSNMDCLLRVNVWLKDQSRQEQFDLIYRRYFSNRESLPTRTRIQVGRLPMNCDVEVEAIGYVSDE
jgi:2-iminobutanoate/2-iminopropanoate deaminase